MFSAMFSFPPGISPLKQDLSVVNPEISTESSIDDFLILENRMNESTPPKRKQNVKGAMRGVIVSACFVATAAALAVDAPYSDNFDSYPTNSMPNNFSTHTSGAGVIPVSSQWSVENGAYRNTAYADFVETSAAVNVTNLAQSNFILSTSFVLNSYGSSLSPLVDVHVGLGALASGPDFSSSGYSLGYELVDRGNPFSSDGALQFYEADNLLAQLAFITLPVATGTAYTMTLMGTYSSAGLLLTGILNNGSSSIFVTITDPTPQLGSYFGYHDAASGLFYHAAGVGVSYDDLSITVPEPQTLSLLSIALLGAYLLQKSRRRI
jgi:hypothetical protein